MIIIGPLFKRMMPGYYLSRQLIRNRCLMATSQPQEKFKIDLPLKYCKFLIAQPFLLYVPRKCVHYVSNIEEKKEISHQMCNKILIFISRIKVNGLSAHCSKSNAFLTSKLFIQEQKYSQTTPISHTIKKRLPKPSLYLDTAFEESVWNQAQV